MQRSIRKLLVATFTVLYGGVAILGYGLHELSPAHLHGHVHADASGHGHAHSHCGHHHHSHSHVPQSNSAGWSDAHECEICLLLSQTLSDSPSVVAVDWWQPCVAPVLTFGSETPSDPSLTLHAPRGPPVVSA
jgi:hypothetical protein